MSCQPKTHEQRREDIETQTETEGENENNENGKETEFEEDEKIETGCPFHQNNKLENLPVYYHRYLNLDMILNANNARSYISKDEHLFITIHQIYELWFKEIIYEIDVIVDMMTRMKDLNDEQLYDVNLKTNRINKIFNVINQQFEILATMTPLNFLQFRDLLGNASGFQSYQFRIIENKLGLKDENRLTHNQKHYYEDLEEPHSQIVQNTAKKENETLLNVIIKWLETWNNNYVWHEYEKSVNEYIKDKQYNNLKEQFDVIFNEEKYEHLLKNNKVKLSYKAFQVALLILLYPNQFQMQNQFITYIIDLNNYLLTWRNNHIMLAHRIIGSKMGTGGTTGITYLRATTHFHQIFSDFINLSTYIIPKDYLPSVQIFKDNKTINT